MESNDRGASELTCYQVLQSSESACVPPCEIPSIAVFLERKPLLSSPSARQRRASSPQAAPKIDSKFPRAAATGPRRITDCLGISESSFQRRNRGRREIWSEPSFPEKPLPAEFRGELLPFHESRCRFKKPGREPRLSRAQDRLLSDPPPNPTPESFRKPAPPWRTVTLLPAHDLASFGIQRVEENRAQINSISGHSSTSNSLIRRTRFPFFRFSFRTFSSCSRSRVRRRSRWAS